MHQVVDANRRKTPRRRRRPLGSKPRLILVVSCLGATPLMWTLPVTFVGFHAIVGRLFSLHYVVLLVLPGKLDFPGDSHLLVWY